MVILEFDFKSLDDKIVNSAVSLLKTQTKNMKFIFEMQYLPFCELLEREGASL